MSGTHSKPTIVLDFDRTLFDTNAYIKGLQESVRPLGVTPALWEASYHDRDPDGVVRMPRHAAQLAAQTKASPEAILKAFERETADAVWYLFADTRRFLEEFSRQANLYLLSFGEGAFHEQKIHGTGIAPYFKQVYLTSQPKEDGNYAPLTAVSQAIFLNDSISEIRALAKKYRWAHHIHINRYGKPLPGDFAFPSFASLQDARGHVLRLLAVSQARPSQAPGATTERRG